MWSITDFMRNISVFKKTVPYYGRNIIFQWSRKVVEFYMKDSTVNNVGQEACPVITSNTTTTNNNDDKCWTYVKNLLQLGQNEWPKFLEELKKLHSAEIYQTETQTQSKRKEPTINNPTALQKITNHQLKQILWKQDCTDYRFIHQFLKYRTLKENPPSQMPNQTTKN